MKSELSAEFRAYLQGSTLTSSTMCKPTRRDGTVVGFTDHDEPIEFDGLTYSAAGGFDAAAVQTSAALNVDSGSLTGLIAVDGITARDIESGLWDGASIEFFEINRADHSMGINPLRFGVAGEIQRKGQQYMVELRGLLQYAQNAIGRTVSAQCDADLGDARCGVGLESLRQAGTVDAVTSNRVFIDSTMLLAANWFTHGVLRWETGANAGLEMEIKSYGDGGAFELQLDMPKPVEVGDTFTATPGCNKIGRGGNASTSTTSIAIGVGSKVFTTALELVYSVGQRIRITSQADPLTFWMAGSVSSYVGSTLTVFVDGFNGSGTRADWLLTGGANGGGDCTAKFGNYNRFRGHEDVPGQDKVLLVGGQ